MPATSAMKIAVAARCAFSLASRRAAAMACERE
jgi:hypothetical protein